jgi:hypothetical protein
MMLSKEEKRKGVAEGKGEFISSFIYICALRGLMKDWGQELTMMLLVKFEGKRKWKVESGKRIKWIEGNSKKKG